MIAGARELFEQGKLTGTLKADFYNNFGVLSRVASPVTVDSLKSCAVEKEFPSWLSNWFAEGKAPKWLPKWMTPTSEMRAALQAKQNGTGDDTKLKEEIDGITETRIHMKSYSFSGPLLSSKLGMPLKVLRT